jgi:Domain of unknown function (DUF929)
VPPKQPSSARTLTVIIIIVIIVIGSGIGYLVYSQYDTTTTTTPSNICVSCIGQLVPTDLYQNLTGVSSSTLNTIGIGQGVTKPSAITGTALTNNGKPEVMYLGADFCPYCAAERWAMIIALSQFGTFSNLTLMLSSASDVFSNTATFTFYNSTYSSSYISFVAIESEDRNQNPLQSIPAADSALESQYDTPTSSCTTGGCIPFIDIGNSYKVVGSQYDASLLRVGDTSQGAPLNWTEIGSQLNNPSSSIAKGIVGAANSLISAICSITGGNPSSVCSQPYAKISLAISSAPSGTQTPPIISVVWPTKLELPSL